LSEAKERYELLVVDDEPQILASLTRQLRGWARDNDVLIRTCADGDNALQILSESEDRVAILLSDNRMPGVQGIDLVRHVVERKLPVVPIMLTGYTETQDVQSVLSSGVFSLIVKPWSRDELIRQLRDALETYHIRRQTIETTPHLRSQELSAAAEFHRRFFRFNWQPGRYGLFIDYHQYSPTGFGITGDYLDIIPLTGRSFLVLLGNIAGYGLKATFVAAIIKSMLYTDFVRDRLRDSFDPAELLSWMNGRLTEMTASMPEIFVTFLACTVNRENSQVVAANAGNPFPVRRSASDVFDIVVPGLALGVNEHAEFHNRAVEFRPEDTLFMFTQGMASSGTRAAGLDSATLHQILESSPVNEPLENIVSAAKKMMDTQRFEDNVTLLRIHSPGQ